MDPVVIRHHNKSIDGFGGGDDLPQKISLAGLVAVFRHRRSNVGRKPFLLRQMVVVTEERQRLLWGQSLGVFRKWLGSYADCFYVIASLGELDLGRLEQTEGIGHLGPVAPPIDADERRDAP